MNNKIKYIIGIIILSLSLTSCYGALENAIVKDKYYEPSYTQWIIYYDYNTHTTRLIPIFHCEKYVIVVEGTGAEDNKQHTLYVEVDKDTFNNTGIGDVYNNEKD